MGWEEAYRRGNISQEAIQMVLEEAGKRYSRTLIIKSNITRYLTSRHPDYR